MLAEAQHIVTSPLPLNMNLFRFCYVLFEINDSYIDCKITYVYVMEFFCLVFSNGDIILLVTFHTIRRGPLYCRQVNRHKM